MLIEQLITSAVDFFIVILDSLNGIAFITDFENAFLPLFDYVKELVAFAYFFLPVDYLTPLISLVFGIIGFRIVISVVNFLVTIIPVW